MDDLSQELPRAFIRSRPIRVAYLLEETGHSHLMLDCIFAESIAHWGGRYSLICPCEAGYPRDHYLPWLRAFDPDIIYSFIDLSEEGLHRLREMFGPAYLVRHRENLTREPTLYDFRVSLPIKPLSALSTTLQYARAHPVSAPQPIRIVDYLPGQPHDRFIDDNFGAYYGSYGSWPMPSNLADVVKPLAVASEQLLNAPNRGRRYEGETIPDATALLRFMSANRNTYGLAQVAADAAPRIELRSNYDNAFMLVVGDAFADRIAFWNLRSRAPVFLGRQLCTLIISPSSLEDSAFFEALIEFLKARNEVPHNSGRPLVRLCSTSLTNEELASVRQRLSAVDEWNAYHAIPRLTLDAITPSGEVLEHARHLIRGGYFERAPEWKEFSASGKKTQPPATIPSHLAHVQSGSLATNGSWALDVSIERQENHSRFINVRHSWFFPRRLRFVQAFLASYESMHEGREYRNTRATAHGALSFFASFGEELPTINLPDDETAFRYALQRGDTWPPFRSQDHWGPPQGPFALARPSDKGRYLLGTLRIFGGLQDAAAVLLHNFWRGVFEELGGAIGTVRREHIKESLKKKVRTVQTQPAEWDEDTWERLAALVAGEAHQVRIPLGVLSYKDLLKRHEPYLGSRLN